MEDVTENYVLSVPPVEVSKHRRDLVGQSRFRKYMGKMHMPRFKRTGRHLSSECREVVNCNSKRGKMISTVL